jgi:hypothetical protein
LTLKGAKATGVTTQGEITLIMFLEVKGPRGTYSQFWTSLKDTSLRITYPKILSQASETLIGLPRRFPVPTSVPISSSKSTF